VFRLGAAWGAAARRRAGAVLLAGAPGAGKGILAHEAVRLARATGGTVVRVRCDEAFPRPLLDALGLPVDEPTTEAATGNAGDAAATGALWGLAAQAPTLLVLDGLHAAGPAGVSLLRHLAGGPATRLLVVATVRVPEGEAALEALAGIATRIDVRPLTTPGRPVG
jgi:hypothetical protein